MTYAEQINHPKWQKVRLEAMQSAGFKCEECGDTDSQLQVHHRQYKRIDSRQALIWEYGLHELSVLCDKCHKQVHEVDDAIKAATKFLRIESKNKLLGIINVLSEVGHAPLAKRR